MILAWASPFNFSISHLYIEHQYHRLSRALIAMKSTLNTNIDQFKHLTCLNITVHLFFLDCGIFNKYRSTASSNNLQKVP